MTARIDHHIAVLLQCSKTKAQQILRSNQVFVNQLPITRCSYKVKPTDIVTVSEGALERLQNLADERAEQLASPEPDESVKFDVVDESHRDFIIINKPYGLTVHPGAGNERGTLVNGLLHRYGIAGLSSAHDSTRPGIVHRLDKDTCGLMVVARNDKVHENLKEQFEGRSVKKLYKAIVVGKPPRHEQHWNRIERAIVRSGDDSTKMAVAIDETQAGAKPAITEYRVARCWRAARGGHFSLLDIRLLTGRTHQIRVHLSSLGWPILGDSIYWRANDKQKVLNEDAQTHLMLAAVHLSFQDPAQRGQTVSYDCELPEHMKNCIELLNSNCEELLDEHGNTQTASTTTTTTTSSSSTSTSSTSTSTSAKSSTSTVATPTAATNAKRGKKTAKQKETDWVDEDNIPLI